MPVQPMKSIAAVAITNSDFGIPEAMAAGILTGAILFFLGVTGLMQLVYRFIPLSVVRGIQLAQGLSFALTAVKYIRNVQDFSKSKSSGQRHWLGLDGLVLALICAVFIIIVNGAGDDEIEERESDGDLGDRERVGKRRKLTKIVASLPSAFNIFLLGVVLAIIRGPKVFKGLKYGPSPIEIVKISKNAWKDGFIKGSSNCPSGQYKFGGRSGCCVALLGAAKLGLGLVLVLGSSLVKFPVGGVGGPSAVCWDRAGYVLKGNGLERGSSFRCDASLYCRFASGLERGPGLSVWDGCALPS
ncbi:hypothetical protein RHSIM_Rhsim07G0121400 [Rhododendron simsii]|uniref:Uncharacterized protein n=1 Tax=Rhododendron simsii TaxID=118357 RepID=A0A834LI45_RHOSS|nr:hypothetical protein RHSIM_Rhsim07G0121400 [Rhododendron simsii]